VHQYFITQLSHEEGLLELIQQVIPNFQCLITYNGKTFDIPILNARFVLNRLSPLPEDMPHIDLLHPTRTIWKYSLENCKLKTIETDRLQLYREDDIPGELIPDVYFDYLRNRRIDQIERIFYHNCFDIITMLANLILIIKSYQTVEPEDNPLTDYAKARLFTRKKDIERSISHYQNVLNSQVSTSRRQKTYLEIAALYKKLEKYDEALHYWQAAIDPNQPFNLEPYIEQAKYFEHKLKDLNRAVEIVEQALNNLPLYRSTESNLLMQRLNRLNLKLTHHNRH
jgi:tetratricopeptide (TPR) repeat protein